MGDISRETTLPPLLTIEQLAKLLQVSTRSVRRFRAAGTIPAPFVIGGAVRWRVEDVRHWIEQGCPPKEVHRDSWDAHTEEGRPYPRRGR